jgi:hypothetical protein
MIINKLYKATNQPIEPRLAEPPVYNTLDCVDMGLKEELVFLAPPIVLNVTFGLRKAVEFLVKLNQGSWLL